MIHDCMTLYICSILVGVLDYFQLRNTLCFLSCSFGHPYDYEVQVFKPTEAQLKEVEPINPLPLDDTPLVLVETEEQLQDMVKQLKSVSEFAVDLEVCLLNSPCIYVCMCMHYHKQLHFDV